MSSSGVAAVSALPGGKPRENSAAVSFQKELSLFLKSFKTDHRPSTAEFRQRRSNALYSLWSSYVSRLPAAYLSVQLQAAADRLHQLGELSLARRCHQVTLSLLLEGEGGGASSLAGTGDAASRLLQSISDKDKLSLALRAIISDALCHSCQLDATDPDLMRPATTQASVSILQQLQAASQLALRYDSLYWHVHNATLLTHSITHKFLRLGLASQALEHLLWCAVGMESCVPLMAVRYLPLRVSVYTAVCQCYYSLRLPEQAEVFARRGLDKVHELAQLESLSSSLASEKTERVFREASIKLGVMVFQRSMLESRRKTKSIFRPKIRPTIKELLPLPTPRSPTEKLLIEMFTGRAAQFLAVLESLGNDGITRRPLEQAPPSPSTELDSETVSDVFQELFCYGTDISVQVLDELEASAVDNPAPLLPPSNEGSVDDLLLSSAISGADTVPLSAVLRFVRLSHSLEQRGVMELLAGRLLDSCAAAAAGELCGAKALRLVLAAEALLLACRRVKAGQMPGTAEEGKGEAAPEDLFEHLCVFLSDVHAGCQDHALLATDFDLLLDCCLLVWEVARPAFSRVTSHDHTSCRKFLGHGAGRKYLCLLRELVEVCHMLRLWEVDALLHGELSLKLACLYEAKADRSSKHPPPFSSSSSSSPSSLGLLYDREGLLHCLAELEQGLKSLQLARLACSEGRGHTEVLEEEEEEGSDLEVLHAEFVFAVTRVRLKLASTIPPPPPAEGTLKPSSLRSKVTEQRERKQQRQQLLADLTAPNVAVETVEQLKTGCGRSLYHSALLSMLQAATPPQLSQKERDKLCQDAFVDLSSLDQQNGATTQRKSVAAPPSHPHTPPPPPLLHHCTDTSMAFTPAPFHPPPHQHVCHYKLYGRLASGSNVRVRLSDKNLPGLGIEVPRSRDGWLLEVRGLTANEEYVFAVAAYTRDGELVGGAIGQTGRGLLAAFPLPLLAVWGYCCQCAYQAESYAVAKKAAEILWRHFVGADQDVKPSSDDLSTFKLRTSLITAALPSPLLRHFIQSVFCFVNVSIREGPLLADGGCGASEAALSPSQLARLALIQRLLAALEVAGTLNDSSLCFQAVLMVYGLLVPLLQHSIASQAVLEVLLRCHSTLCELPESQLQLKSAPSQTMLHHSVAVMAYHTGTVLLAWQKKALFSIIADNARGLLLITMPPAAASKSSSKDIPSEMSEAGLQQSSLVSAPVDPSTASCATFSSALPSLLPQKTNGKKKRSKRKVAQAVEQVSDESKSAEYKSFEAFVVANQVHFSSDDVDLTGQEDPVVLHAVIASLPSHMAYKEVHKFRKRPQYLEFFVHLASLTVSKGYHERVLDWSQEAFHWLSRRNELLLTAKPPPPSTLNKTEQAKTFPATRNAAKQKGFSAQQSTVALMPLRNVVAAGGRGLGREGGGAARSRIGSTVALIGGRVRGSLAGGPPAKGKQPGGALMRAGSRMRVKKFSVGSSLDLVEAVRITRDDVELKALAVLHSTLPLLWRKCKARKRLRVVSKEELPWRSQANVLMAGCYLHSLLGRAGRGVGCEGGECVIQLPSLLFDAAGVLIEGVIPAHKDSIPGLKNKSPDPLHTREEGLADAPSGSSELSQTLTPSSFQTELARLFTHYQRAVVLAHRGQCWTLLQNVCRALTNAITSLIGASTRLDSSLHGSSEERPLTAVVYGLACKPLYFAACGLTGVLERYGGGVGEGVKAASLHPKPGADDCSAVAVRAVRSTVFQAIHTLYVHQHWEKLIEIALRYDDVTEHLWSQELVPIVCKAQQRLAQRLQSHKATLAREAIEPAAHLDPGPRGHDVYGAVGHSLALSCVPMDPDLTRQRLGGRGTTGTAAVEALLTSRQLLARYLAAESQHLDERGGGGVPRLEAVVSSYEGAAGLLAGVSGAEGLAVQAMHELGNVLLHTTSDRSAVHWWKEGLSKAVQEPLPPPPSSSSSSRGREGVGLLGRCGLWGCVLGGVLATKLARYGCHKRLSERLHYTLLAADLFKAVLCYSLPHPSSDLSYVSYQLARRAGTELAPGVELFSGARHRGCHPGTVLDALQWASRQLVARGYAAKALPVLWLYQHVAHTECRDVRHTALAKITRVEALSQLSLFPEAVQLLIELLSGARLPQSSNEHDRQTDSHMPAVRFSNSLPLTDPKNLKALHVLLEKELSPSLELLYGEEAGGRLLLARAALYTRLAGTASHLPQTTVLARSSDASGRPPTALSTASTLPRSSAPSSASSSMTSSTEHKPRSSGFKFMKSKAFDVKLYLLDGAEKLLVVVCSSQLVAGGGEGCGLAGLEVRVRAYLGLASVALSLQHSASAVQLSTAALHLLETQLDKAASSQSSCGAGGVCVDGSLWLECRVMLARSLVGTNWNGLSCDAVCTEALEEAWSCGEGAGLSAHLHYIAALHAVTQQPANMETVVSHTQSCLELLEAEFSQTWWLLRCQASLLLADASCIQASQTLSGGGGSLGRDMVTVFQGLATMLEQQDQCPPSSSSDSGGRGMYAPQLPLLAACKLRHTHILLLIGAGASPTDSRCYSEAHIACREGVEALRRSAHSDPALLSELCFHSGWLQHALQRAGMAGSEDVSISAAPLIEAARTLSEAGADYRLAFLGFCELAQLYECSGRRPSAFQTVVPDPAASPPPGSVPGTPDPASSRLAHTTPGEVERTSKVVRDWNRERSRETFAAWYFVKLAQQCQNSLQSFKQLASELHNEDACKPLSEKAVSELPDFALLDLCASPPHETLDFTANSVELPPVEALAPTAQYALTSGLTWFKVLQYLDSLLQQCFWPSSTLHGCSWQLHYNSLSSTAYPKFKALLNFVSSYFPPFVKACKPPSIPPAITIPQQQQQQQQKSGTTLVESNDFELTVVWYRPYVSCNAEEEIAGLFALNAKAVKTLVPANLSAVSTEVHTVHTTAGALQELYDHWVELGVTCRAFLEQQALANRPVSRSPSKQRKGEKTLKVPQELQLKLLSAVEKLCQTFSIALPKEQLPRVEPHSVSALAGVLRPFSLATVKGDAYYFFKHIFSNKHPTPD